MPGCHGFLEDDERLPHRAVQGQAVAGMGALRVVQQDQVQPLAPELLAAAAHLPAHVLRGEAVPDHGLVLGENPSIHAFPPVAAVKYPAFVAIRRDGSAARAGASKP